MDVAESQVEHSGHFNFEMTTQTDETKNNDRLEMQDETHFKKLMESCTAAVPGGYRSQKLVRSDDAINVSDVIDAFHVAKKFNKHENWHYVMPGGFLSLLRDALALGYNKLVPVNGTVLADGETGAKTTSFPSVALICKFESDHIVIWERSMLFIRSQSLSGKRRRRSGYESGRDKSDGYESGRDKRGGYESGRDRWGDDDSRRGDSGEETDAPESSEPKTFTVHKLDYIRLPQHDIRVCVFRDLAAIKDSPRATLPDYQKAALLCKSYCCTNDQDTRKSGLYYSKNLFYNRNPLQFCMRFPAWNEWLGCMTTTSLQAARMSARAGVGHRVTAEKGPTRKVLPKCETPPYELIKVNVVNMLSSLKDPKPSKKWLDSMLIDQKGPLLQQMADAEMTKNILKENTYLIFKSFDFMEHYMKDLVFDKDIDGFYKLFKRQTPYKYMAHITCLTQTSLNCVFADKDQDVLDQIERTLHNGSVFQYCRRPIEDKNVKNFGIKGPLVTGIMETMIKLLQHKTDLLENTPFLAYHTKLQRYYVVLRDENNKLYQYNFYPFKPTHISFCVLPTKLPPEHLYQNNVYQRFLRRIQEQSGAFCQANRLHKWIVQLMQCTMPFFMLELTNNCTGDSINNFIEFLSQKTTPASLNWLTENPAIWRKVWEDINSSVMCNCLKLILESDYYMDNGLIISSYEGFDPAKGLNGEFVARVNLHVMTDNRALFSEAGFTTTMETAMMVFSSE